MDSTVIQAAREIVEALSWRQVQGTPEGPLNKPPDAHWYVIGNTVDDPDAFWRFVKTIRAEGRRGKYVAPYNDRVLYNRYLVLDDHVYWFIRPMMLNRTLVEYQQHEWLEADQLAFDG